MNGFSFCTNSKIDFTPINSDVQELNVSLKENLEFYPKDNFEIYSAVFFQSPSTLFLKNFLIQKNQNLFELI